MGEGVQPATWTPLRQAGRGEWERRSGRGLITFALGFIPVYSNLSTVARGTRRAGGARPGGDRGVGGSKSGRDRERRRDIWKSREIQMGRQTDRQGAELMRDRKNIDQDID